MFGCMKISVFDFKLRKLFSRVHRHERLSRPSSSIGVVSGEAVADDESYRDNPRPRCTPNFQLILLPLTLPVMDWPRPRSII